RAAGIGDAPAGEQLLHALQVDRAPDAARRARREPVREARLVHTLLDAVDPPEAQRFVHGLLVGEPAPARRLLVEPDPQLTRRAAMRLQPGTEIPRRRKVPNHRIPNPQSPIPSPLTLSSTARSDRRDTSRARR